MLFGLVIVDINDPYYIKHPRIVEGALEKIFAEYKFKFAFVIFALNDMFHKVDAVRYRSEHVPKTYSNLDRKIDVLTNFNSESGFLLIRNKSKKVYKIQLTRTLTIPIFLLMDCEFCAPDNVRCDMIILSTP